MMRTFLEGLLRSFSLTPEELRSAPPAHFLARSLAAIADVSLILWFSTFALRGVALRFRAELANLLGVHTFTLAIDAGTIQPSELASLIESALAQLEVDLWDTCFVFALAAFFVVSALSFIYFSLLESAPLGQTAGKAIFSLRVVDHSARLCGMFRSIYRQIAKCLTILTLGIGFAACLLSRERKAFHDSIASTRVVRVSAGTSSWYRGARSLILTAITGALAFDAYQRIMVVYHWYELLRFALPVLPPLL